MENKNKQKINIKKLQRLPNQKVKILCIYTIPTSYQNCFNPYFLYNYNYNYIFKNAF